ncbi:DUF4124 domain-containing protein [Cellvibrio sp. UBA7661]|uniref:DUF4124 domain-containing protein n=1 Tax=Cellvibrio sp. UBA7661 TaxID=1946311 RepID=UPI002F350D47
MNLLSAKNLINPIKFMTSLCIPFSFYLASTAHAEIYKYTDAQGKVHYSDKKIADSAQAQNLNLGTMPQAKAVESLPAKRYQNTRPSLYLLRSELALDQLAALRSPANFAYFYFGGDCVSPTAVNYGEYIKRYKNSLPESDDLYRDEGRVFDTYKFRSQRATYALDNPQRVMDEEGNPPLKLNVDITDMRINACTQRLEKASISGNLDKISGYHFDKANVWLQLRITITHSRDDVVLLNTIAEGSANEIDGYPGNISRLTTAAYEQAITNLIANPTFVELLTPKSKIKTVTIAQQETPSPSDSGGMLSRLADKLQFNAVNKAKLAEAMSLVSPVRISIVQYYAETGKWPSSFSDIDLSSGDLIQKDLIEQAELRLGGVLHLRLDRSTFGENEVLQLVPKPIMNGQSIDWECRTSLDKAHWVGDCQGL